MAHDPQALTVRAATRDEAVRAFAACAGLDPERQATPESAADAGELVSFVGPFGVVHCSINFLGRVAWIVAGAGGGNGMAGPVLEAIEKEAKRRGCECVGFQTVRPGLRRIAEARGYVVTDRIGMGVKMEKKL